MPKRIPWLCVTALLATAAPCLAEVEVLHGATLRGGSPPDDVVVIRGSAVGGALPDPEGRTPASGSFLPRRGRPEAQPPRDVTIRIAPTVRERAEPRWAPAHRHAAWRRGRHPHADRARPHPAVRIAPREPSPPRQRH